VFQYLEKEKEDVQAYLSGMALASLVASDMKLYL